MRIEVPHDTERLGAVLVHGVQKVFELDSSLLESGTEESKIDQIIRPIAIQACHAIEREMAIVVPVHGERIKLVEGVLCGIPNHCLTIICSNSAREPVDRYAIELAAFLRYSHFTQKRLIIVHQKDPTLAEAFRNAGFPQILDERDGLIRSGKAEGMVLAMVLAKLAGSKAIGFVDSDNYFPGAVLEYVREYSAGLSMSNSPYAMVRISWHSKPKVIEQGLFFARYGRTSRTTNRYLNQLIAEYSGFETEIITTGNAGEHAMTMALAMQLDYSSGYSIEPYHFINLFEKFGGLDERALDREMIRQNIEIFQIESRNPHMHDVAKGDEHIDAMAYAAMRVIHDSPICPPKLRDELAEEIDRLLGRNLVHGEGPTAVRYYPTLSGIDLEAFRATIRQQPYATHLLGDASQPS